MIKWFKHTVGRLQSICRCSRKVREVEETTDCLQLDGPDRSSLGFNKTSDVAYLHIGSKPAIGEPANSTPRYRHKLNLPAVRS